MGKYYVNLAGIAQAVATIRITTADGIFMDELGPMEMTSRDFQATVDDLVHSDKQFVVGVHGRLATGYGCIEIAAANRDALPGEIAMKFHRIDHRGS